MYAQEICRAPSVACGHTFSILHTAIAFAKGGFQASAGERSEHVRREGVAHLCALFMLDIHLYLTVNSKIICIFRKIVL